MLTYLQEIIKKKEVAVFPNYVRVFHKSFNVAGTGPAHYDEKNAAPSRRARACPSPGLGCS